MTEEEKSVLLIRGYVAGLKEEQQTEVKDLVNKIRQIVSTAGPLGSLAVVLVGQEEVAKVIGLS